MSVRVGMIGVGHVHAPSYVWCCEKSPHFEFVGAWDKDGKILDEFVKSSGTLAFKDREALAEQCDALVVAGENMDHAGSIEFAVAQGKHVICEKPIAASEDQFNRIATVANSGTLTLMTAFPCPYSPAFESALNKIANGEIGKPLSICATNHGKCPFGWFTEKDKSGGGAMADHVVHVADLLRRILKEEPVSVHAIVGNNMYGQDWEDSAMLTLGYPCGAFATIDSSWSRPKSFKTWGDVTLKIVGEKGVIELDLFVQTLDAYSDSSGAHAQIGFGSNLDLAMLNEFAVCIKEGREPRTSLKDGLAASRVALDAYRSVEQSGRPKISL